MSWESELSDYQQRIRQAAYQRLEEEDGFVGTQAECDIAADVNRSFGRFAYAHWASCDHMQTKLHDAHNQVTLHVNDHLTRALGSLATWTDPVGDAVKAYLGACSTAVAWRMDYIQAMQAVAALQKEVIKTTRSDVRMVAQATIEALEHRDTVSLSDAFAIAGAVTTVMVTVTGPVAATGVVAAFVIADKVRSVFEAGSSIAEHLGEPTVEGGDTFAILSSSFSQLNKIRRAVEQREEVVSEALKGVLDMYQEHRQTFHPVRQPVDIYGSEQLRTLDSGLIQDAAGLIPTIATDNRNAASFVASVEENEPHAFEGDLHDPPKARWQARRIELQEILETTANELDSISSDLEAIATTYQGAHAASDQGMNRVLANVSEQ